MASAEIAARNLLEKSGTKSEEFFAKVGAGVGIPKVGSGGKKREERERLVSEGELDEDGSATEYGEDDEEEEERNHVKSLRREVDRQGREREEGWRVLE